MREIKLTIDGKEFQLTEEQVKTLAVETKTNPFNRMGLGSYCYAPHLDGTARTFTEDNSMTAILLYRNCSYFNDKAFAEQVALHQLLYRKLLKFAYDNECEDDREWDGYNAHHYIFYNYNRGMFGIKSDCDTKAQVVYFSSSDDALRAIREVVKPFIEEHPDFVW